MILLFNCLLNGPLTYVPKSAIEVTKPVPSRKQPSRAPFFRQRLTKCHSSRHAVSPFPASGPAAGLSDTTVRPTVRRVGATRSSVAVTVVRSARGGPYADGHKKSRPPPGRRWPGRHTSGTRPYFTSMVCLALTSAVSLRFGSSTCSTPCSTRAEILSFSTSSGSIRVCWNFV